MTHTKEIQTLDWVFLFATNKASLDLLQSHIQKKSVKHWYLFFVGRLQFLEKWWASSNFLIIQNFAQSVNMQLSFSCDNLTSLCAKIGLIWSHLILKQKKYTYTCTPSFSKPFNNVLVCNRIRAPTLKIFESFSTAFPPPPSPPQPLLHWCFCELFQC